MADLEEGGGYVVGWGSVVFCLPMVGRCVTGVHICIALSMQVLPFQATNLEEKLLCGKGLLAAGLCWL